MPNPEQTFERVCDLHRDAAKIETAAELLEWDERTGMPSGAAEYRAEQVMQLRGIVHRMRTKPEVGDWLDELANWDLARDPHSSIGATVHHLKRDFERKRRLPTTLVESIAGATVRGQGKWDAARRSDDYRLFQPSLDEMLCLKREAAAAIADDGQSLYEALLDEYEPGGKVDQIERVFDSMRSQLVPLIAEIRDAPRQPDPSMLRQPLNVDGQAQLSQRLAQAIGFDFSRGRLDTTSHPFCTTLGPSDCRILTRYEENHLATSVYGTLHEAGHGLYEQGLPTSWFGLPPGQYASLGIHESQSRLWENLVGRTLPFCQFALPMFIECLPQLAGMDAESLHAGFNVVAPSLIRVEADEATYNLHILIRFELERALIAGDLKSGDLPGAWDDAYESTLGIRPPSAADGVLQDVHWSAGLIGYFPTYSLGNLAAAQLMAAARESLPDLDEQIRLGQFEPLLHWLRHHVHRHGRCYSADELVRNATGKLLSIGPLIDSLRSRYAAIYELS
ncbi:MAG: carboxypeptidase M32 [Planctomycetota bacterium]